MALAPPRERMGAAMKAWIPRCLCAGVLCLSGNACTEYVNDEGIALQPATPVAVAVAPENVAEETTVTLDGSASHDPDDDLVGYQWTQSLGPTVDLSGADAAIAAFTAPNVGASTLMRFTLTVTDSGGRTDSVTSQILVTDRNAAPVVTVSAHQVADARTLVTLTGAVVDPEGGNVSVKWSQESGPAAALTDDTTLSMAATLPDVEQVRELTFRLTATDPEGKAGFAEVSVTVRPVAARLRFSHVPLAAVRNTPWATLSVEILNLAGSRITGGDAAFLTVELNKKTLDLVNPAYQPPPGSLIGTLTGNTVAGVVTFSNVMYDTVTPTGNDAIVQASVLDPRLDAIDSSAVSVTWPSRIPGLVSAERINATSVALVTDGPSQDFVVGGSFTGTDVNFALPGDMPVTRTSSSGLSGFVARYNGADGNLEWVRAFTGTGDAIVSGVAVDDNTGKIFIAVDYKGVTDFPRDGEVALPTREHSVNRWDVAVARLTSDGSTEWLADIGGDGDDRVTGLVLDSGSPENVIVAGYFGGLVNFNPDSGATAKESTAVGNAGDSDAFVLKLSNAGTYTWHWSSGAAGDDKATAVAVRRSITSYIYLTGTVNDTTSHASSYFTILDSTGVAVLDSPRSLTSDIDTVKATGAAVDATGNLYIVGDFQGTVDFDPNETGFSLTAGDYREMFLAAYDIAGNLKYATKVGNSTNDVLARRIAVRDGLTDSLIIAGQYTGSVDFDTSLLTEARVIAFGDTAFLLSLDLQAQFEWVGVVDPTAGYSADAMAVATTGTRVGFVGWAHNGTGAEHDIDIDPSQVSPVTATLPATSESLFLVHTDDKGWTIP